MALIHKLKSLRTKTTIKKLGFINLSFIIILSLHFIPIIIEEFKKAKNDTMNSKKYIQKSNFVSGLKNYSTILPTVFLKTLEKAETISKEIDETSYETFFEKTLNQE
jgi:energy-coupling factor transporter transmembrane protein EcfT